MSSNTRFDINSYPVNVHHKEREKMTPSGEAVRA